MTPHARVFVATLCMLALASGCTSKDSEQTGDTKGSTSKSNPQFQTSPKLVMEEIIRAANTQDYSNLAMLSPPDDSGDGDTKRYICRIAEADDAAKKEFTSYFKTARITGEASIEGTKASIPFWYNHPGGESRSNEEMNMKKMDGKWYLISF